MASSEFIVEGAMAKCNQSKVPMIGTLQKPFDNQFSKTNGKTTATTMTLGPAFGVQPFGICNMIPPTPAMPTPPCVCMTIKWDEAYLEQSIGPMASHPLTKDSKATCALGGTIEFVTTGQMPKVSVVNVASLSSSSTNTISKDELDEKADFKMPENVDLTKEKELLTKNNPNSRLAKNDNILYKVHVIKTLLESKYENTDFDDIFETLRTVKGGKNYNDTCDTLLNFTVAVITKNIKVTNIKTILGELRTHNNTQIGAEWILRDLAANAEPNSTIKFEDVVKDDKGEVIRRVDVVVGEDDEKQVIEYKSVKDVPPGDFDKQFGNDLNNKSYGVDQVKWRFDGDKLAKNKYPDRKNVTWNSLSNDEKEEVRCEFREKMRNDGLNKVEMDENLKDKLMANDKKGNAKFDSIFIIA
ncbi:MAG: PAAR-like protein [Bacteroidales bacterium]|nr:PAAR-like protein [Bacteroidales bacterium]